MIQSLHIFRKDVRHLWADLVVYAALLIAASVVIPMGWNGANASLTPLQIFIRLLNFLIPIMWLIMISRLIHDESLVGDTQFWITRPYKWASLLGAKLLFIVVCVALPFAVAQWATILQAGLNPLHTIPAQLLSLLKMGLIVWLTFTVVASVTSTVQRMFMSILAVMIFWGVSLTMLGSPLGPRMELPSGAIGIIIGGLLVGILLYQYASRNTFASRMAIVVTALLLVALFACLVEGAIQGPVTYFVRHHYSTSENGSLRLAYDPNGKASKSPGEPDNTGGKLVMVLIPVSIQGLDSTVQLDDQNVAFTVDAPGYHYASPWRPAYTVEDNVALFFPQRVLDKIHESSVRMHISEVAQRLLPGTPETVTAASDFNIPGNGRCHLRANVPGNNVICRYPFEIAARTTIRTAVVAGLCGVPGPASPSIETLAVRSPINGPDPTIEIPLRLGGAICPGTPITFTAYHPGENFRLELDIPSIAVDQYVTR